MTLYDDLGVAKDAGAEDIRNAFRKKAKQNHPDVGGDGNQFQIVKHAYDVLSNPDARRHYDETGNDDMESEIERLAEQAALTILEMIFESDRELHEDLISAAIAEIEIGRDKMRTVTHKTQASLKQWVRIGERSKGPIIEKLISAKLERLHERLKAIEKDFLISGRAQELLQDQHYEPEETPAPTWTVVHRPFTGTGWS